MKKIESGRSMIEMLGVLAIIGVLSIGGLAGYTMAMNRYRAANISDYVSRCVVVAQTQKISGAITANTVCTDVLEGESTPAWLVSPQTVTLNTDANGQITAVVASMPSAVVDVLDKRFGSEKVGGVSFTKSTQTFTFSAS